MSDMLSEHLFSVKFVAFKTPSAQVEGLPMPKRVYFCFKFFTFSVLQTQPVWLNTSDGSLKFNQQYYLTTKEAPTK